jgi:peptidoglycan hydrolase CwlO-like protein
MSAYFCTKTGTRIVAPGVCKDCDPVNGKDAVLESVVVTTSPLETENLRLLGELDAATKSLVDLTAKLESVVGEKQKLEKSVAAKDAEIKQLQKELEQATAPAKPADSPTTEPAKAQPIKKG